MNAPLCGDTEETMKLTKKLLLASAVLCAASLGFMACNNEDDPEGAITGSNNTYKVYYENPNGYGTDQDIKDSNLTGVYRAWKRTSLKHLGALTKITLGKGVGNDGKPSNAGAKSGVMGFAWDLKSEDGKDSDEASETFNVVGIRNYDNKVQAYLSRYYNVTNKNENNFGATALTKKGATASITAADVTGTVEWDISNGFSNLNVTVTGETLDLWVDVAIRPVGDKLTDDGQTLTRSLDEYASLDVGGWIVAIYDTDPSEKTATKNNLLKCWTIPAATTSSLGSGYSTNGVNGSETLNMSTSQKKQAVYANIYKYATLSGEWHYEDIYHLANVAPVDGE